MAQKVDLSKLKTSWTKYDIVHVMDVIQSVDTIESYKNGDIVINEAILKSFLNIKSVKSPTPTYWETIQNYPAEKQLFALLAVIFTHIDVVDLFATYSNGNMGGVFIVDGSKMHTNIRSALVEAGASLPQYRRQIEVLYDFSSVFKNANVGVLFKEVLKDRISQFAKAALDDERFYTTCYNNRFDKALGLSATQFRQWLEGVAIQGDIESCYINQIEIRNFYSIKEANLTFANSKEVYLLGENGDGKSLILMAIYIAFKGHYILNETDYAKTGIVAALVRNTWDLELRGTDNAKKEYGLNKNILLPNFYAYGTHRGRPANDGSSPEAYGFMSLFDIDETLANPISWLLRQKMIDLEKRLDEANMFSEDKSYPVHFSVSFLENLLYELLEKNVSVEIDGTDVRFIEKGHSLTFAQLSEGYRSILIFAVDFLIRLTQSVQSQQVDLKDLKGSVLIDEIDQHLHPRWQRIIVKRLRSIFPQVQFIMTTHSPTIIQGASDDAIIYRVYRDQEDGHTNISEPYYRKELDHLMINSLVTHPLFGLDDARMDSSDNNADTSETYLLYRINKKIEEQLEQQKRDGKKFISDEEIDDLIEKIMKEEMGK